MAVQPNYAPVYMSCLSLISGHSDLSLHWCFHTHHSYTTEVHRLHRTLNTSHLNIKITLKKMKSPNCFYFKDEYCLINTPQGNCRSVLNPDDARVSVCQSTGRKYTHDLIIVTGENLGDNENLRAAVWLQSTWSAMDELWIKIPMKSNFDVIYAFKKRVQCSAPLAHLVLRASPRRLACVNAMSNTHTHTH